MAMPKETLEAVKAFMKIAVLAAENFKDGVQASDLAPIIAKLQDPVFAACLFDAYNGIDKVPAEMKEVTAEEALQAIAMCIPEIVDLIKAIKK
jgi:hypothetical protein